jgi:hypothetical protein
MKRIKVDVDGYTSGAEFIQNWRFGYNMTGEFWVYR